MDAEGRKVEETYEDVLGKVHAVVEVLCNYCTNHAIPFACAFYPPEVDQSGVVSVYTDTRTDPVVHVGMLEIAKNTLMLTGGDEGDGKEDEEEEV